MRIIIMKKKLILAVLMVSMTLAACGNKMSPSEAAAAGVAPAGAEKSSEATSESSTGSAEDGAAKGADSNGVVLGVDPSATAADTGLSAEAFAIKAGSVNVKLGDDFMPNIDAVGIATIEEGQACLEGGFDTNYYYGGEELVVYTVAKSGKQIIYDIYVSSDKYETAKGAKVGTSTKDDVTAMYGEPTSYVGSSYVYALGSDTKQAQLEFDDNGVLKSIDVLNKEVE